MALRGSPRLYSDRRQKRRLEARNRQRQMEYVDRLILRSLRFRERFELRPHHVRTLHRHAIRDVFVCAGKFRQGGVGVRNSTHEPPPEEDVAWYVDDMCGYVHMEWERGPTVHLGAYLLWRVNWIHPFMGGNGRTARALALLVMGIHARTGLDRLGLTPDDIIADLDAYYDALDVADRQWARGRVSVYALEKLIERSAQPGSCLRKS